MKTFLKIVAAVLAFFIVIAIGLNIYFTDERLKNTVMPYVDEAVGRTVNVEKMSLTIFSTFPQPGISIQNMSIPGETNEDTLLALDEIVVSVELFSLLGDQLNISEISLQNPRFTYVVNADSTTNIDFLMTGEEAESDATSEVFAVNIPHFNITGGNFSYRDATTQTNLQIDDLNADISLSYGNLIKSSVNLQLGGLSADVSGTRYLNKLPMSLSQESTIDLENETLSIDKGTFSIRGLALNLTGSLSEWSSKLTGDLSFKSSSDNFGELLGLVPDEYAEYTQGLQTSGSLSINGTLKGAFLGEEGEELPAFDIGINVDDGYIQYPDLPKPIENINIDAKANQSLVTINNMELQAAANTFSLKGAVQNPLDEQNRSIDLNTRLSFDLATIKDFYPIDEDTLSMRGKLTADATLKGKADQIERSVQSGNISLIDGYISHKSLGKPIENFTLKSSLNGPVMSITDASFISGENNLDISGTVNNYLSANRTVDIKLSGKAALDQIKDYYELEPTITELTGQADLNLRVQGAPADPVNMKFNGQLTARNINMDGDMVQPVKNLNGELMLSPRSVDLKSLTFDIGSSDIALSGSLSDYMEYLNKEKDRMTTPHLKGSYKSKQLNLDELIDWSDTTETTEPTPIHLPDLTSSVSAEVDKLVVTAVTMTDLEAQVSTSKEQIKMDRASVEMFGGKAAGAFTWDVPDPQRTMISFEGNLDSLQASAFFDEFQVLGKDSKFHEYVSGAFSAKVAYFSELNDFLEPLIETSTMDGNFKMTNSRIQGHPLQERLASMFNAKEFNNVGLDEFNSTYTLKNSILRIQDLKMTSDDIGMELNGTQHMVNGKIDYQTKLFLPGRFKKGVASVISSQAADALTQENGTIMVPLRMRGTQENPKISPDKEVIDPIVKDLLKDKARNVIKGLFNDN